MNAATYLDLKEKVIKAGYADDVTWAEDLKPCTKAVAFFTEYAFVVINSGMKAQIARNIFIKALNS